MPYPLDASQFPKAELAKARKRHLVRQSVLLQRPLTGPMEVGLVLTYRCNHGCAFCALPGAGAGKNREMAADLWNKVIDDLAAAECEQVSLTGGGEPLMHPSAPAIVEKIRARGMACSVCTNGSRLTVEQVERWAKLGVHLAVSFNAAKKKTYREVHRGAGEEDYERILDRLRFFAQTAQSAGGEGSFVSMNFVVHSANVHEIGAMADLARQVGAAQIQYRLIQPRSEHRHLMLTPVQHEQAKESVRRVEKSAAADSGFTVQVAQALRTEAPGPVTCDALQPGVVPQAFYDDRTRAPCLEGYIAGYIDADGTVFPCCLRSSDIRHQNMGDITRSSFLEIWHGDEYQAFRRESFFLDQAAADAGVNSCAYCPKAKHFLYLLDEFAPGNYLALLRNRNEALDTAWRRLRQRVPAHTILPPPAMRPAFVEHRLPAGIKAGATETILVTVRNDSQHTWPGFDIAGDHGVGLGYHLLDRRGRMVRFDNNPRAYLAEDLAPGQSVTLALMLAAPDQPGEYEVELAMVQERVRWFEEEGGATLRLKLEVTA